MEEQKILDVAVVCGLWQGLSTQIDVHYICGNNVSQCMGAREKGI